MNISTTMKYIRKGLVILICLWSGVSTYAQKDKYLIEAEKFQFKGKWFVENQADCLGRSFLRLGGGGSNEPGTDALTVINITEEGEYNVWVRSFDHTKHPGTRLFTLSVDEQVMKVAGAHGHEGFYWEKVGKLPLKKQPVLLRLHDTRKNFARCDAILLVKDDSVDPNQTERVEIGKWRKNPVQVKVTNQGFENLSSPLQIDYNAPVVASVENKDVRLSFVRGGVNNQAIACRTEIKVNGNWRRFLSATEDHKVFLLTSGANSIIHKNFYPSWEKTTAKSSFTFNGKQYTVQNEDDLLNPYMAGSISEAVPVGATKKDEKTIEVEYLTKNGSFIIGEWILPGEGNHIEINLSCQASQKGLYSLGVAAFQPIPAQQVNNVLLPPIFQYKRLSPTPVMLVSSMMQQPLAVAEAKTPQGIISSFISGDDTTFPKQWGSVDFSPMGFSIKNENNEVQPVAFAPVLGMEDSRLEEGDILKRKFVIGIMATPWNEALEYISDNLYKVRDYRKQTDVSLTEAMFNILDLMKDKEYSGWDTTLKGFYDIEGNPETAPTVVHPAPLAIIAASVFSDDEDFFLSHALPTIEYTLSRSGYRWAVDVVPSGYNSTLESLRLNPFKSQFNTSYYEGMNLLLGELNPWLETIALPGDTLRVTRGYSAATLSWVQSLSAYKMTKDEKWLRNAISIADRYIDIHIYKNTATPQNRMTFYNTGYAAWWDLIDLYEITKDKKYLEAAQVGAAHTIAGIRSFPAVEDKLQTIHPGNKYDGNTNMWWKGKEKYRLGFPRVENDVKEKQVPEWLVSPVGLGFEQPATYFLSAKGKQVRPVFMSNWAPHLLRLYQYTGKPIYETYARNAVIGRFTNYPGYYATGYTDITTSVDFPYKGPDVSSIYYHHLPPHLAFTWDYLVSEAIERAAGNIYFPYSKQEGFVWFANRIYGREKGKIFNDNKARLWMKKGLLTVNNPSLNYVTAISDKNFWILLSSESGQQEEFIIELASSFPVELQNAGLLYGEKGRVGKTQKQGNTISVTVPAKGFRAVSLPLATASKEQTHPVLKNGMKIIDMGEPLGKIFLYRIRSPFGWDSVYGFAETPPVSNQDISMEIECNGQTYKVSKYPFEWSFYKLNMAENATVRIKTTVNGQPEQINEIILNNK